MQHSLCRRVNAAHIESLASSGHDLKYSCQGDSLIDAVGLGCQNSIVLGHITQHSLCGCVREAVTFMTRSISGRDRSVTRIVASELIDSDESQGLYLGRNSRMVIFVECVTFVMRSISRLDRSHL